MGTLGFKCRCGELAGELRPVAASDYTSIVCHCADCRSHYTHLGLADPDKVGIVQTSQDRVHVTRGGENLRVFRLSPRGALRWYATCCDTPLFYTPARSPRMTHVGVMVDAVTGPVKPAEARGFVPDGRGGRRHEGVPTMVGRMLGRMAKSNLSGAWRDSPFFEDGAPVVPPRVLSREERAAALMGVKAQPGR